MTNWIEKWLIDKRQRVVVDGEVSNWKTVLSGVHTTGISTGTYFILYKYIYIYIYIYINDLDDDVASKVLKFADDTKCLENLSDADIQYLQDDLNKLTEWSEKWQMLFIFGKCKCL